MKYLRNFNESSTEEIDFEEFKKRFEFLRKKIDYALLDDRYNLEMDLNGKIVYRGDSLFITIDFLNFNSGELKIDRVDGRVFTASYLTTLVGCPSDVSGNFNCLSSNLTSLIGCPKRIGGRFYFSTNKKLSSLEGGPEFVGGSYDVCGSYLSSLVGAPKVIFEDFNCSENELTDLVGAPEEVRGGDFMCHNNLNLTSLKGLPKLIEGDLYLQGCRKLWDPSALRDCQIGGGIEFDDRVPFWDISMIFPTMEDFINSLDYNYIKSPSKIDLFRFKEALDEIEIDYLKLFNVRGRNRRGIGNYHFIDDQGRRVDFDGKILKN